MQKSILLGGALFAAVLVGCGSAAPASIPPGSVLEPPTPFVPRKSAPHAPQPAPAPATPADLQKKALVDKVSAFNAHDAKKLAELYAPGATITFAGPEGWKDSPARESVEAYHAKLWEAQPDVKVQSARILQKGDLVVQEWVTLGTHKATSKPVGFRAVSVYRFNDKGLVTSERTYVDPFTVLAQTGVFKGKARAVPALPATPERYTAQGGPEEEKRVAAVKAFYAAIEKKSEKDYGAALADAVVWSNQRDEKDAEGAAATKKAISALTTAMPDVRFEMREIAAIGDFVVVEGTTKGTHKGAFGAATPSNKPLALHEVTVFRFMGDKVLQAWSYGSTMELLAQAGQLPKREGAVPVPTAPTAPSAPPAVPGKKP